MALVNAAGKMLHTHYCKKHGWAKAWLRKLLTQRKSKFVCVECEKYNEEVHRNRFGNKAKAKEKSKPKPPRKTDNIKMANSFRGKDLDALAKAVTKEV